MKKILLSLTILFIISSSSIFSAETLTGTVLNTVVKIADEASAIEKDRQNQKFPYYKDLKLKINDLDSTSDLDLFYQTNRIPILWPTLQSLVFGFGTGVKAQGQIVTSRIYLNIDTSILSYGLGIMGTVWIVAALFSGSASTASDPELYTSILQIMAAGLVVSHGVQTLNTLFYGIGYNIRLKRDLNLIASVNPINQSFTIKTKFALS